MSTSLLKITCPAPHVALITLDRAGSANALNTALALQLADKLKNLPCETRAAVLTGSGGRAFSAGADLKERQEMDQAAWEQQHQALRNARDAVLDCSVPVIAAVEGAAYGGGLELALACDFIYASDASKFALPEATLGIMPGMGGVPLLTLAVGKSRAAELLFTGKPFSAQQAEEWGIVNRVCATDQAVELACETAETIARNAPLPIRAIKRTLRQVKQQALTDGLQHERLEYPKLIDTDDRKEGITAYHEKRPPRFSGN